MEQWYARWVSSHGIVVLHSAPGSRRALEVLLVPRQWGRAKPRPRYSASPHYAINEESVASSNAWAGARSWIVGGGVEEHRRAHSTSALG